MVIGVGETACKVHLFERAIDPDMFECLKNQSPENLGGTEIIPVGLLFPAVQLTG